MVVIGSKSGTGPVTRDTNVLGVRPSIAGTVSFKDPRIELGALISLCSSSSC